MGQWYESISEDLAEWIKKQKIFFVATAPLDAQGCVNSSPKGHDALRILGPNQACYLEMSGSGIETQSHLEENGRITLMMAAFEGGPRILRLIGTGRVVRLDTPEFNQLLEDHYKGSQLYENNGKRAIIMVDVRKVGTTCGYAVPFYDYRGERPTLMNHWAKKDREAMKKYWLTRNTYSLDGLPGMRHEMLGPEWAGKNRQAGEAIILPKWATHSPFNISAWFKSGSNSSNATILATGIAIGAGVVTLINNRRR
ncbi:hypothetical protein BX616_002048 [Lobosporangium transversale]|uniref:Pyridoxamine 5'-phosphate oxidase N-terminal domain-containing protein n=1 Tax=Lobosporangium transversale TaxID=64571 RepID=A0A1Y2G7Y7_9FUNG|nr:hypothetical protein BCR41DRAFT_426893 [Lobosporangium transversale]KAF9902072.1 hypothetical protein BX616_002048 [Lobosporangium transversale]ORY95129.1 hypothetical protein BCR41DRAFT_426893 [Lobosporangium transversale]|eukprot:XP_021875336.1 hypothetical protein BCR41DRAFT_426893 [Lobosporangium transversale]